jgi:protoheme IX farnesyltransferase
MKAKAMIKFIFILSELAKIRIALLVTFSMAAGSILARGEVSGRIFMPALGIFFLASGGCALNQYQERAIDGLMQRTRRRPIPSGRMHPSVALTSAVGMIFLGFVFFLCSISPTSSLLGAFALLWYNGVYTSLKRRTALASVPGALVGMFPPAIGWISGGGSLLDAGLWVLALFFFLWQVPHFWLLGLEYANDYEKVGYPSLRRSLGPDQIRNIISIWLLATGCLCFCMPLFLLIRFLPVHLLLIAATLWLYWGTFSAFRAKSQGASSFKATFRRINLYALWVIFLLSADTLLSSDPIRAGGMLAMMWR